MNEPDDLLTHATVFRFPLYPEGCEYVDLARRAVTVEWRGGDTWAVVYGTDCYDAAGSREYESSTPARDDHYLARFRFSRGEAVRIAREVVAPAQRAIIERVLGLKRGRGLAQTPLAVDQHSPSG